MSKKQRAFWDGFMQKTMFPETKALQDLGKKLEAEQYVSHRDRIIPPSTEN